MSTVLTPTNAVNVNLTTTALQSLGNSATVGWMSDRVDNTVLKASNFRLKIIIPALTASGNDAAIYVYCVPWYYDNNGVVWYAGGDGGTTMALASTQGSFTIAERNNLGPPLAVLNNPAGLPAIKCSVNLSNRFGALMPDGWQLVVINYSGASLTAAGNNIAYTPVTYVSV